MPARRNRQSPQELRELLRRDHTLNGGILFGIDGYIIEIQARAIEVAKRPISWDWAVEITGMATGAVTESMRRIRGAFAKLDIPDPQVEILINLAPADLPKAGTWLDLPLAIIMLQAAGVLPDMPEHIEGDFVLMGEIGIHGEVRRVPGGLSLAFQAKAGQKLIVPYGNEKECALILAKPGHEGCKVYAVATLEEVIEFFQGKRQLENALKAGITFDAAIPKAVDFGRIRGQEKAKRAAMISAAGGHRQPLSRQLPMSTPCRASDPSLPPFARGGQGGARSASPNKFPLNPPYPFGSQPGTGSTKLQRPADDRDSKAHVRSPPAPSTTLLSARATTNRFLAILGTA